MDLCARLLAEAERWVWYPPGTEVRRTAEYELALRAGSPAEVSHCRTEDPDRVLALVAAAARGSGATGVRWTVDPGAAPARLTDFLLKQGFVIEEDVEVLGWDLGTGPLAHLPAVVPSAEVAVQLVQDGAQLRLMHRIAAEACATQPPDEATLDAWAREVQDREHRGQPHAEFGFLGYWCGHAAGSAGYTLDGGVVRLWGAGTLPAYRSRGVYRALVMARLLHAHGRGASIAVVKARSGTSGPILRRLGFRFAGTSHVLVHTWSVATAWTVT